MGAIQERAIPLIVDSDVVYFQFLPVSEIMCLICKVAFYETLVI